MAPVASLSSLIRPITSSEDSGQDRSTSPVAWEITMAALTSMTDSVHSVAAEALSCGVEVQTKLDPSTTPKKEQIIVGQIIAQAYVPEGNLHLLSTSCKGSSTVHLSVDGSPKVHT
jgi:hypothetical protein